MGKDTLRYDQMVEEALRGVVRRALSHVAEHGLPGPHHFYVTFDTTHPGVELSPTLRARYPKDMTIILQYQFWGLEVSDDLFFVTLSFNDRHERITVPFEAITAFADPGVKFGLRFETTEGEQGEQPLGFTPEASGLTAVKNAEAEAEAESSKVVALETFRKK